MFNDEEIRKLKMSNDEDTVLLLGLGLSLNQARVYLAILTTAKNYGGTDSEIFKSAQGRRL